MQTLKFVDYPIEKAELNGSSPYPSLSSPADQHSKQDGIFKEDGLFVGYGRVNGMFPYRVQEGYGRKLSKKTVKAVILESDTMRAVFFTEYGCRLWSLYDKTLGRELLHANEILQFGNLAIRNAWFAGGVEWNIGMIGHTPFTCSPMFCERVTDSETGAPVLRFYEYERIRGVIYEVDAYISDERRQLMVRVRIKNAHDHEIPMYWWSNMAVPETLTTRVITDADSAYSTGPEGIITRVQIPVCDGVDVSYTTNVQGAVDYFFRVPKDHQKFIAAADVDGNGILQTSTARLKGRKLFLWGMDQNGRRWQDFLSKRLHPYIEIQSGLATTQCECLPMGANEEWEWLEAYGALTADGDRLHGDWNLAISEIQRHLVPESELEAELVRTRESIVGQKGELLQTGSGWGYVEQERRRAAGEAPLGIEFPKESVTDEERAWLSLIDDGTFPVPEKGTGFGYMMQPEYIPMLKNVPETWFSALQLGLNLYANGRCEEGRTALLRSAELKPNAYAYCGLSDIEKADGRTAPAADLAERAARLDGENYSLAKKAMELLLEVDPRRAADFCSGLNGKLRENGRMRFLYVRALLACDLPGEAEKILSEPLVVDDLREGEKALQAMWDEYCLAKLRHDGIVTDDPEKYIRENMPLPEWVL